MTERRDISEIRVKMTGRYALIYYSLVCYGTRYYIDSNIRDVLAI